ncbi:hypothetical protein CLIB1444_19S01200 [[Candida] jaroonii]|uniref:Uncharacterized protein n=1 Tax=[Candida] jaroonii TaxID=467808 RepID=A0ACA9YF94_9ASCO|nr:hypothetical protein CLIB1444_19S01200 [[Candida] jaroonii]
MPNQGYQQYPYANVNLSNFEFNYKNTNDYQYQQVQQVQQQPQPQVQHHQQQQHQGHQGHQQQQHHQQHQHQTQNQGHQSNQNQNQNQNQNHNQNQYDYQYTSSVNSSSSSTHSPTVQAGMFNHEVKVPGSNLKVNQQEILMLKQLLSTGEKYKWKQITKDINNYAADRNGKVIKNISPTFVIKQYQTLLGLPNNQMYFGMLGSSLPYVVHGWENVNEVD